jgi:hypothetical protein
MPEDVGLLPPLKGWERNASDVYNPTMWIAWNQLVHFFATWAMALS